MNSKKLKGNNNYFLITYDCESKQISTDINGLCVVKVGDITHVTSKAYEGVNLFSPDDSFIEKSKRSKGILVSVTPDGMKISNDPFCTIPVYYYEKDAKVIISSSPNRIVDYSSTRMDPIGVCETILYGSGIWTRTPFIGLSQLPSACTLNIDKTVNISRYWDFNSNFKNCESFTERDWLVKLDELFMAKFSLYKEKKVVMGMSGGMDCRVTAMYLSEIAQDKKDVSLFTYADNPNSHEYKYAKKVSELLGFSKPDIFVLNKKHYADALTYLPFFTAGQISNAHCHITQYLKSKLNDIDPETIHLSTYYSDAIFGWECSGYNDDLSYKSSSIYKKLLSSKWLDRSVSESIEADIKSALEGAINTTGISSIDEYKYITERNAKFHMSLAFIQDGFVKTSTPFADYDILNFILAMPVSLRKRKNVIDELIAYKNKKLSLIPNSSSREYFYGDNNMMTKRGLLSKISYFRFKTLNALSAILAFFTSGRVTIANPYQTEDLRTVYLTEYKGKVEEGILSSEVGEIVGGEVYKFISNEIREKHIAEKYHLVSFMKIKS